MMELDLKKLERLSEEVQGWSNVSDAWASPDDEDQGIQLPTWIVGSVEDGVHFDVAVVDCEQYSTPGESEKLAKFYAAANPAVVMELVRRLREAEIRLHDVAAHCANVEAELAEIKPAKPATAQVQLNDSEMEMIARAHGTGGWQTLDDMAIFARSIEAAVLRANGFDIQPAKPVVEMGMREEFEKWAAENGLLVDRWDHAPDSYIWFNTSLGWKAWQAAQHATRDDSARLDFLDQNLAMFPIQMGWNVGVAPGGNVSITTVIGGQNNIRESIDFAMQSTKGAK